MFIQHSTNVDEVLKALVRAKSEIGSITKGSKNPFFKSKYADLSAILNEVEPVLEQHGLAVLQPVHDNHIVTTFVHSSGQYISILGTELVAAKENDPQAMGSAITYARRYSISAALSLNAENDDDGERAMKRNQPAPNKEELKPGTTTWQKAVFALRDKTVNIDQIDRKFKLTGADREALLIQANQVK